MNEQPNNTGSQDQPYPSEDQSTPLPANIRSLKDLIDTVTGKYLMDENEAGESGFVDQQPFPFLALVGQKEMKLALLLNLINPAIGGVLLLGPRGTGKTTAVRSLANLTPRIPRSLCYYGCTEQDVEAQGIDAICPACAKKYGEGKPLTQMEEVRLVELPLNAQIEDVVGGIDERAAIHQRMRLKRGILSQADRNILYVDEVNLLEDDIINAILDASAMGTYTVRRGPISSTYFARFSLVGSMNPEEGTLRPQIMDRFGLRILVDGLEDPQERWIAYQHVDQYRRSPNAMLADYQEQSRFARTEVQHARDLLPIVQIPEPVAKAGLHLIQALEIASLRAEISLFEASKAYAAADNRSSVEVSDLEVIAPMALRMRRSPFMSQYFSDQQREDQLLRENLSQITKNLMEH
jgi:magnesium chelatase subunit I